VNSARQFGMKGSGGDMRKTRRALVMLVALAITATIAGINRDRLFHNGSVELGEMGANAPVQHAATFRDPLDMAAEAQKNLSDQPMMSVAWNGKDFVAVGMRGLIATAPSPQGPWQQSKVPVESDLLSVQFIDSQRGWAVGHDGVVLHTTDGGKSWFKQLDGRQVIQQFRAYYQKRDDQTAPKSVDVAAINQQLQADFSSGPSLPFRDVLFNDANVGYIVGAFGLIAVTRDGGKSWYPLIHQIDNPDGLHLNAIRAIGGGVYIAGERGRVYRLDSDTGRFVATSTGYAGSFFGVAGNQEVLLAFGLRGTVYRSTDQGKTWTVVQIPTKSTLVGGAYLPGPRLFVLATDDGQLVVGDADGMQFRTVRPDHPMRYTDLRATSDSVVALTGLTGVRFEKPSLANSLNK
jgi:photosystem II stability/assembly factor-like uncharacterized protein